MTSVRRRFETRVGPFLVLLHQLPRPVPFLLVAALLVGGLAAGGALGAVLLLLLAALLGALLVLSWPALPGQARGLRVAVVALVAARGLASFWV